MVALAQSQLMSAEQQKQGTLASFTCVHAHHHSSLQNHWIGKSVHDGQKWPILDRYYKMVHAEQRV
jgi:hypothetical protein